MNKLKTSLTAAALCVLAGCQSLPSRNPTLDAAEQAYTSTAADPQVQRHAAGELERVRSMLTRAKRYWEDERDEAQTRHLAYLATRQLETLRVHAAQREAEAQMSQASAERDRVRLEARDAELRRAQSGEDAARRTADALQRDLAALNAQATQRGLIVTLQDVLFATGRAELQSGAQRSLQRLAQVLQQHLERRVLLEGFADSTGGRQMNLRLSQRRADAVRRALVREGVAPQRIEVRAFGEDFPAADNGTAAGRQQNRRVEVLFSDEQGRLNYR